MDPSPFPDDKKAGNDYVGAGVMDIAVFIDNVLYREVYRSGSMIGLRVVEF